MNKPKKCDLAAEWAKCVICLEEFPPHLLLTHDSCNINMCSACSETCKTSSTTCPVCGLELRELERVAEEEKDSPLRWSEVAALIYLGSEVR